MLTANIRWARLSCYPPSRTQSTGTGSFGCRQRPFGWCWITNRRRVTRVGNQGVAGGVKNQWFLLGETLPVGYWSPGATEFAGFLCKHIVLMLFVVLAEAPPLLGCCQLSISVWNR